MRILVIGRFYQEAAASFIVEGLEGLGHSVYCFDPGPKLAAFGSRAAFYFNRVASIAHGTIRNLSTSAGLGGQGPALRRVLERVGTVDFVLSTHDYLTPKDAALVKALAQAPLALWYPDPIWSFQRHMFLNAPYDALFFKDPYLVDLLRRKLEIPVFYMPECFSPASLSANGSVYAPSPEYSADLCTAGNLYAYRVKVWNRLADFDAKIWGLPAPLWMDVGAIAPKVQNRFVAHAEKARAFRSAKIVVNNLNPAEIWGTNVRTFEICGAGSFQLVDWRAGLSQLFTIGEELVAFDTMADLRKKINYFLDADEERETIAKAGRLRALREHTYEVRLPLLIDTVMGRAQGFPMPLVRFADD